MKKVLFLLMLQVSASASAQNIDLASRVSTVVALDGKAYYHVTLVYGDLDGVVWRGEGASGGRICYTNLSCDTVARLGIPTNRIALALKRAGLKSRADARYAAERAALAQANIAQRHEEQKRLEREQAARAELAAAQALKQAQIDQINSLKAAIARDEALSAVTWGYYVANPDGYRSVTLSSKGVFVDSALTRRANARAIELRLRQERRALERLQKQ